MTFDETVFDEYDWRTWAIPEKGQGRGWSARFSHESLGAECLTEYGQGWVDGFGEALLG